MSDAPSASSTAPPSAAPQPATAPPHPPAGGAPVHRDYAGDRIVVHWNAERCIHTGRCIAAQRYVFDPKRRPWVDASLGTADQIVTAIERVGPLDEPRTATGRFALCQCGQTGHAPYCDNSHRALAPGWGADDRGVTPAPAPAPATAPDRR